MSDVVNLGAARAEREGDNRLQSPLDMLQKAADDFALEMPTGAMVLHLTKEEGTFDTGWYASNLSGSEMIALIECIKATILREMGFTC